MNGHQSVSPALGLREPLAYMKFQGFNRAFDVCGSGVSEKMADVPRSLRLISIAPMFPIDAIRGSANSIGEARAANALQFFKGDDRWSEADQRAIPLKPVFANGLATTFLGEEMRWFHVAGMAKIYSGIAMATTLARRRA